MSLYQIHYESTEDGSIIFMYVAAANLETAIKRFRETSRARIITVNERSTFLLT